MKTSCHLSFSPRTLPPTDDEARLDHIEQQYLEQHLVEEDCAPPDLQELVAAAGGHDKITPEMWAAFDRAMDVYQQERREGLANDPALAVGGVPEQTWPYARCVDCGGEAHFGYRDSAGALRWFCATHRLARWWADARR